MINPIKLRCLYQSVPRRYGTKLSGDSALRARALPEIGPYCESQPGISFAVLFLFHHFEVDKSKVQSERYCLPAQDGLSFVSDMTRPLWRNYYLSHFASEIPVRANFDD